MQDRRRPQSLNGRMLFDGMIDHYQFMMDLFPGRTTALKFLILYCLWFKLTSAFLSIAQLSSPQRS
jgi:hypothetical protein